MLSINELVAIAVLAAFASGDYKTAGVVAFFMLHGRDHRNPHRRRRARFHRVTHQAHPDQSAPHHAARRGGSRRQGPGDWRRDPHPPGRQRGGGRRHPQRPGLVQPGHHHRRIAAGGQEAGRRGVRRHAEPDRRAGDQGQPGRHRHHAGPRARADPGGGEDQAADHEDRGPVHGLLHAAGAGHRRAGLGLHRQGARAEQRHLGHHLQLPLRLHPGHADGDGGRAFGGRAPGHPHQERRRHRGWRRRSTPSSSTRPAR